MKTNNQKRQFFFLRGLVRESAHWGDFPQLVQKNLAQNGELPLIDFLDLPGTGQLVKEASPLSLEEMATALHQQMLDKKKTDDVYLIAISLGGMIALKWANLFPHDFKKIVLMNTSVKGFNSFTERLRPSFYPTLFKILCAPVAKREKMILSFVANSVTAQSEALPKWIQIQKERPVTRLNAVRQIWAAALSTPPTKPEVPMLILSGAQDRLVNPICSLTLAQKFNLPHFVHPEAGHDLPMDAGTWVSEHIAKFI